MTPDIPKIQRIARVATAFSPGAPIDRLTLFQGRFSQMQDVVSAVSQRGYHVGLYGERGVGKTSLANVLAELFRQPEFPDFQAAFVTCNTESTYQSVWRDIFRELNISPDGAVSPENVRWALEGLDPPALIVIDELDRMVEDDSLTLFADTIKTLSDHVIPTTIVLIGVADSITDLIGEHQSIVRNLQQVEMPRMSRDELANVLEGGFASAGLTAELAAIGYIVELSEGLPHYTHLLGLHSGQRVVREDRSHVELGDISAAIPDAIARHSIRSDYLKATRSPRSGTLHAQVLLACALVPKQPLGYFTAGSIRQPLEVVAGRRLDIPAFARHLAQLLDPARGSVLTRTGERRRFFYRFTDPLLEPYIILSGLADGLITDDAFAEIDRDVDGQAP